MNSGAGKLNKFHISPHFARVLQDYGTFCDTLFLLTKTSTFVLGNASPQPITVNQIVSSWIKTHFEIRFAIVDARFFRPHRLHLDCSD